MFVCPWCGPLCLAKRGRPPLCREVGQPYGKVGDALWVHVAGRSERRTGGVRSLTYQGGRYLVWSYDEYVSGTGGSR